MKTCTKCMAPKDETEFGKDKNRPDDRTPWCKLCRSGSASKFYKANSVRIKARIAKYAADNKESVVIQQRRWRKAHPDRIASYNREQNEADPGRARRGHLRRKYGMADHDFEIMLRAQGGRCANPKCRTDKPGGNGNRFHIDHDHETGKVRGLLCGRCNAAAGLLDDRADRAYGLFEYLTAHRTVRSSCSAT